MSLPPRTAAALQGRIGMSHEVRDLLSRIESDAVQLLDQLLASDPSWHPELEGDRLRAIATLGAFLDDPARGALPRALRRLDALVGAPHVRRSLEAGWRRVHGMATRLLKRRDALAAYAACFEQLTRRAVLRWHTADLIARWRFDPAHLTSSSAPIIRARHAHLEREMARLAVLARTVPQASSAGDATLWPEDVSKEDVWIARRALPALSFTPPSVARRRQLRTLAKMQLAGWLGEDATSEEEGDAWEVPLAVEVLERCDEGHGSGSDDLDARSVVLLDAVRRAPWASGTVPVPEAAPRSPDGEGFYIRPLFGEYVLIQSACPSPVRVVQDRLQLGDLVDATVRDESVVSLPFRSWGQAIFAEPDLDGSTSYAVQERAQVAVVARVDAVAWLGRVTRAGRLCPRAQGEAETVTLRNASCFLADVVPLQAEKRTSQTGRFGGVLVRDVEVPVEDHPRAELHSASNPSFGDPLDSERRFLIHAAARLHGVVPRPVGQHAGQEGFLYAPHVARRISFSTVLERIRDERPLLLAGAVARLWGRLTGSDAQVALGLYHPDALAFRCVPATVATTRQRTRIEAVVSSAPFGCRLGEPYPRHTVPAPVKLARLGKVPLEQFLVGMDIATEASEARMALLCIAELLTRRAVRVPDVHREAFGDVVRARAAQDPECFHDPELVARIAEVVSGPDTGVLATACFFQRY